jgi:hypothetical protein
MRKRVPIILICLFCLLFSSCATISIIAPVGQKVMLASETTPVAFSTTKKVFYLLWGLVPISNNSTDDIIAKYNLENVRFKTQYDFIDVLVSFVFGDFISLHSKTIVIEGNTKK